MKKRIADLPVARESRSTRFTHAPFAVGLLEAASLSHFSACQAKTRSKARKRSSSCWSIQVQDNSNIESRISNHVFNGPRVSVQSLFVGTSMRSPL